MTPTSPRPRLDGRTVLVSRPGLDDPFCRAVAEAGGRPVPMRLTTTVPADAEHLQQVLERLARADWWAFTSATTVRVLSTAAARSGTCLAALQAGPTPRPRVAAVGAATARALTDQDVGVDLVPAGPATAAGLVAAWPDLPGRVREGGAGRVVVPGSALSSPTLVDGLRAAGWQVGFHAVYTTEACPDIIEQFRRAGFGSGAGWPDLVFLTAGSRARALVGALGTPPPTTRVVTIGEPSARAARAAGLHVDAVAADQSPAGMVAAGMVAAVPGPAERSPWT